MQPHPKSFCHSLSGLFFCLALAWGGAVDLRAADAPLVLQAQLIWGTDSAKPDDAKCKDVGPDLRRRLSRVFKWKHYYEMRRKPVTLQGKDTTRVAMSGKCLLKFSLVDPQTVEVRLIGEGRLTKKMRQPLKALKNGEILVLAGNTKDDINDAWFVVISVPKPDKEVSRDIDPGAGPEEPSAGEADK
jgi:hypothetical protein